MSALEDPPTHALTPAPGDAGLSLLQVLSDLLPNVATADLRRLFRAEGVLLGGHPVGPRTQVVVGQRLEAWTAGLPRIRPQRLPGCEVLAECGEALALFKPSGVVVEDASGTTHALRSAILHALRGRDPLPRPRLAHRLDRDTSGVLLVALSRAALRELSAHFAEARCRKTYLALVRGVPPEDQGECELPLAVRGKRSVVDAQEGKPSRTRWEVLERFGRFAWLRVFPETGRQHQIRVHLAASGFPLALDPLYGERSPLLLSQLKRNYRASKRRQEEKPLLARLPLHASAIAFELAGAHHEVEAPLPKDLQVALKGLRRHDPA